MDELLSMSVVEMSRRIRDGELSPLDALDAHISRIEEVNPRINAVVETRFEDARDEAKKAQERVCQGSELPALLGVPCTIKDCYAVKGLPWSGGVWARRNMVADYDAAVVERVKQAGAIVMGKTNVPEASMWIETYNHVYGRTKNPYDLERGAGGSSGGEGAIVAASGSPFGIGADIGGSIRYPSAFNGVAGHKHTARMLPGTGHWPPALGPLANYNTYGPIARRVDDLAYILPLLAGPDGKDPVVEDRELGSIESVDLKKVRAYYFDDNGQVSPGADVRRAIGMAAGALAGERAPVELWRPRGVERSVYIWQAAMSENPEPFTGFLGTAEEPVTLGREVFRFVARSSKVTLPALLVALVEKPGQLMRWMNKRMLELAWSMQAEMEERLGDDGVLICPVFPGPAPRHTWIWLSLMGMGYSGIFNVLGFPATIIPVFHRHDGLPVSVQVVAGRWNDHLTLAVARFLEQTFGGWRPIEKVGSGSLLTNRPIAVHEATS